MIMMRLSLPLVVLLACCSSASSGPEPECDADSPAQYRPAIPAAELELGKRIGAGTEKVIYAGRWREACPPPEPEMMKRRKGEGAAAAAPPGAPAKGTGKGAAKKGAAAAGSGEEPRTQHLHGDITKIPTERIPSHDRVVH